ncbi:MAG: hypothetical protein ACKO0V_23635, partial [bacterium]
GMRRRNRTQRHQEFVDVAHLRGEGLSHRLVRRTGQQMAILLENRTTATRVGDDGVEPGQFLLDGESVLDGELLGIRDQAGVIVQRLKQTPAKLTGEMELSVCFNWV